MRRHTYALLSAGFALTCCASAAMSKAPESMPAGDPAVAAKLNEAGYAYRVDKDGDYAVVINFKTEKRSQKVFVSSKTNDSQGIKIREVFSFAAQEMKKEDRARLEKLLQENGRMRIGAWTILGDYLCFVIQLQGDFSAKDLAGAMSIAATAADNKEIEFTGDADKL